MRSFFVILVSTLVMLTPPALGAATGDSDQTESEPSAWQRLQQATDPDIVAIRKVLEVLIQDRPVAVSSTSQPEARRVDPMDVGRMSALENRVRRLESDLGQLRAKVSQMR